jgi:hypothetical protein
VHQHERAFTLAAQRVAQPGAVDFSEFHAALPLASRLNLLRQLPFSIPLICSAIQGARMAAAQRRSEGLDPGVGLSRCFLRRQAQSVEHCDAFFWKR